MERKGGGDPRRVMSSYYVVSTRTANGSIVHDFADRGKFGAVGRSSASATSS